MGAQRALSQHGANPRKSGGLGGDLSTLVSRYRCRGLDRDARKALRSVEVHRREEVRQGVVGLRKLGYR